MRLEDQVVSLELSKKLKELGVKQESYFVYFVSRKFHRQDLGVDIISNQQKVLMSWEDFVEQEEYTEDRADEFELYPAYSVAELGEMLPGLKEPKHGVHFWIQEHKNRDNSWTIKYMTAEYSGVGEHKQVIAGIKSEADVRAKMLIYLLENNLL